MLRHSPNHGTLPLSNDDDDDDDDDDLILSPNGDEFFNKLLSRDPDPGHHRGGPSHGCAIF